jgi:uncharacterized phage-associated protein
MKLSANDIAAYILERMGSMTTMKLQKLLYYCQAWSLVWDEESLFSEPIEAWASGPVIRELYNIHRGQFKVDNWSRGKSSELSPNQKETIDSVLKYYGDKNSQWLSDLTHMEEPWKNARKGLTPDDRGDSEISLASMIEYYSSLDAEIEKETN